MLTSTTAEAVGEWQPSATIPLSIASTIVNRFAPGLHVGPASRGVRFARRTTCALVAGSFPRTPGLSVQGQK